MSSIGRIEKKTVLLMCCGDKIAVRKRREKGVLSGMWELPNHDGHLSRTEIAEILASEGIGISEITECPAKKHIFTHIEWQMNCFRVECTNAAGEYLWATAAQMKEEIALPTAFKKFLK